MVDISYYIIYIDQFVVYGNIGEELIVVQDIIKQQVYFIGYFGCSIESLVGININFVVVINVVEFKF